MNRVSRMAAIAILLTITAAACRKQPELQPQGPDPVSSTTGDRTTAPTVTSTVPPGPDSAATKAAIARNTAWVNAPLYFGYDLADLSMDGRSNLDQKIAVMRANPAVRIRIEGHCDSRGSDEYNIALGQRRAAAAKDYMTARGIDASRIETISYGEERPAAQGETETAYSRNRRDEFTITGGAITNPIGN